MALYKIKDIFEYHKTLTNFPPFTLLFGAYWLYVENPEGDKRPEYIKLYSKNATLGDPFIVRQFGDWLYCVECDSVADAYEKFTTDNYLYTKVHDSELSVVWKTFNTEFNPLENYDRTEITGVGENNNVNSTSGVTSKVSPDDNELFYNTNENSATSGTIASTQRETNSHIHGNIGVTSTTALARESTEYFGNNGMYDYLVNKLIGLNCILIV